MFSCHFVLSYVWAYTPTPESLFRNASNPPPTGTVAILKVQVSEEVNSTSTTLTNTDAINNHRDFFLNIVIHSSSIGKGDADLLQEIYSSPKMTADSLLASIHTDKFVERLKNKLPDKILEQSPLQNLFYSTLFYLTSNRADIIGTFLMNNATSFPFNSSLINKEKVALLKNYLQYLTEIKNNPASKKGITSPLSPVNPEEKRKVQAILNQNIFYPSDSVTLVKEGEKFYWKLVLNNFEAFFTNEEHNLTELVFDQPNNSVTNNIEFNWGEYSLLDGTHELPSKMQIKINQKRIFNLKLLSIDYFTRLPKAYQNRNNSVLKVPLSELGDKLPFIYAK